METTTTGVTTDIVWRSAELDSAERFTSRPTADGWEMAGTVVLPVDGSPGQVTYRVDIDRAWRTRALDVTVERAGVQRRVTIAVDAEQRWRVDGRHDPALDGCIDVDLSVSPSTNTLLIRRLARSGRDGEGDGRTVPVAWLDVPSLRLHRSDQTYTRLAVDRWRFAVPGFVADLEVDAGGHVLRYGDDVWTATAHSTR